MGSVLPCETIRAHTKKELGDTTPSHSTDFIFCLHCFLLRKSWWKWNKRITVFFSSPLQSGANVDKLLLNSEWGLEPHPHLCIREPLCHLSLHSVRCLSWLCRDLHVCFCFGRKMLHVIFGTSNAVASPTPHPLLSPLLSLFSIDSSQSLYNPCNHPAERAGETLFFLTLIPIDPILEIPLLITEYLREQNPQKSGTGICNVFQRRAGGDAHWSRIHTRFPWEELSSSDVQQLWARQSYLLAHGGFLFLKNYCMSLAARGK